MNLSTYVPCALSLFSLVLLACSTGPLGGVQCGSGTHLREGLCEADARVADGGTASDPNASTDASSADTSRDDSAPPASSSDLGISGAPSTNTKGAPVGAVCRSNEDCAKGGFCATSWKGGYCVIPDCNPSTQDCPGDATCISGGARTVCLANCTLGDHGQGTCRDAYVCANVNEAHTHGGGVCTPPCTATSCAPGLACNASNGVCETKLCASPGSTTSCGASAICCGFGDVNACIPDCRLPAYATFCGTAMGPGSTCTASGCCSVP